MPDYNDPRKHNMTLRNRGGLWLGKTLTAATRIAGKGGTTLPGRTAAHAAPHLLPFLASQLRLGSLVITGTNGKTTTAYLLANIFRRAGLDVLHNRTGSNLTWGVASAFINASSWQGRVRREIGVMESDEGAFPAVVGALRTRGAVVTNIFRDQLDRYGEVDQIRAVIRQGLLELPGGSPAVLNADDPSLVFPDRALQERRFEPIYYGLQLNLPAAQYENTGRDLKSCPLCREKLTYSAIYYAHLGRYRCPSCSFRRPEPAFKLLERAVRPDGKTTLTMALPGGKVRLLFPLPGLYNVYNALAAAACAFAWGLPADVVAAGLEQASPSFGRMEQFQVGGRRVWMGLIKNPVGANEVLRTFLEIPGRINLLIAINDNYADGTDISWLWDVDFEQLQQARERLAFVAAGGVRAADMAVRLKYAGLEPSVVKVEPDLKKVLERCLREGTGEEPLLILPTYTAMLGLRRIINRRGIARPYWEE